MKTFGTIGWRDGSWVLKCEPHVLMRLKRVFPRISERAHGEIVLRDNLEVSRDLLWFCERYPLEPTGDASSRLADQARKHHEQESLVEDLLSGIRPPTDYELAIPPRGYQRVAADLVISRGGLLLTDDLGIGKTCSGICVLSRAEARPALVVTMTHLTRQWAAEINRFAPRLNVHVLKKGTPYDLRSTRRTRPGQLLLTPETPDVIVTNYHKLSGWADTLSGLVRSVIYDEAQELRRTDSDKYAAAKCISDAARFRLGLTATPIYNYGDEIFAITECILPGVLGSRSEFLEEWCKYQNARAYSISDPQAFGTYARTAGIMLRRTRADVGRELPDLTRSIQTVDSDAKVLAEIESPAAELARLILEKQETTRGEKFRAAEELSGLVRQATGIAKAPYVAAYVRMLVDSGEPVVLFGWHRAVYDLWTDQLKDLKPALYTGSESEPQKAAAREAFLAGKTKLLIMSLRSGAGLDGLQRVCRTVVFGELDWSPGVHEQCIGRIHRDQQKDPVVAYFLVANDGCDPIMVDVLGLKRAQSDGIRDPSGTELENLDSGGQHGRKLAEEYLRRKVAA